MAARATDRPSAAIIGTRGYPSYYGGFETAVRHIAPHLADAGWDVTVYGREGAMRSDDPTLDPRVRTVVTGGLEKKSLSTLSHGLTAVLDTIRRRPDVALVMNCANGYWLPLLRLAGIPTVVNVDGIEWERAKWGRVARAVFRTGAKATARAGDRLVFDADAIGAYWRTHFDRDGVVIPYGGAEPDGILPLHALDAHLAGQPYTLMVARFVPENSVPEFLAAAERIAARHPVVLVGSSGYGGELDEAAARLATSVPGVHWLGHVADDARLFALWQHAGAYFHGHSVGGTNPALVQAMHCGAPIVARDTVYNREVLQECGRFTAAEPGAIVDTVLGVLDDPRGAARLGAAARARALDAYTWAGVCTAYEHELRAAAGLPERVVAARR